MDRHVAYDSPNVTAVSKSRYATPLTILPCVYVAELDRGKFYVGITHHFNEVVSNMRYGLGPRWTREYPLKRIIEVNIDGNVHSLHQFAVYYIIHFGHDNVRSSIPGHHSLDLASPPPEFYKEWVERFST